MVKMDKAAVDNYKKAKSISDSVMSFAKPLIKGSANALEVTEKIETEIKKLGGGLAFPLNVSVNENAAHYTPDIGDTLTFKSGDLVKIDLGVHVDGYIWDRAFTVCIGKKTHPLIDAADAGLKASMKMIKPGAKIFEISEVVESTLEGLGFNPIRNLCGHGLECYKQHARFSIPNGRNNLKTELEAGQAIAMEVFATDGAGWVKESSPTLIFAYVYDKAVRMPEARKILDASKKEFNKLPFAKRWLMDLKDTKISQFKLDMALKQLIDVEALREYPILKEEANGLVAQAEETILI
jgi:methionyl aminopeptidase